MDTLIMNTLNIYIFIFLFPGLLMTIVYRHMTKSGMYSFPILILYASLFSVINIIIASFIIYYIYGVDLLEDICNSLVINGNITDSFKDYESLTLGKFIKIVYVFSVPIGVLLIKVINSFVRNKYVVYLLIKLRLATRFEFSVWDDFLEDNNWVLVRDYDNNIAYYGYRHYYSEEEQPKELYLRKVQVKDNKTFENLYEIESVLFVFRK